MDRNSVIGLVLIGLLLIGYTLYQRPSDEELARQKEIQDSIAAQQAEPDEDPETETQNQEAGFSQLDSEEETEPDSALQAETSEQLKAKYGALASASKGEKAEIEITTDLFKIRFSNKGGVPVQAELTQFTTYDSLPLMLFTEAHSKMGYEFTYPSLGNFNTSDFYFATQSGDKTLSGDEEAQLTYTLQMAGGREIKQTYTFKGNSYEVGYDADFYEADGIVTNPKLIWEMSAEHNEKSLETERSKCTIFYKQVGDGRDYLSETGEDEETIEDDPLQWIAFKQKFFSAILIGEQGFGKGAFLKSYGYEEENDSLTQYYRAEIPLGSGSEARAFSGDFYFGPNDYKILKTYGMELDKVIDLGWGIFGWVNKFVVIPIFDWLQGTGLSYGIIILILTLIIKTVLSPLTFKNYKSSAKMRVLKPEIEALNEKHKDGDAMKKQQATMDLYRKTGVSPLAGCIPMLIQLPILYAMFRFFPSSIQLRHEPFLWADDLSAYDSIASLPFSIPAYGDHVSLFTLLMCASTFVYTIYNSNQMPTQTQPGMPNMKVIMYIFPFMMLFFFNNFASGLSYYYFLANVISIIQMLLIKKFFIDEDKIKLQIAENKKKKAKKGKSKFQKKLEQMAKERGVNAK